ncbi:MAG: hypothetical protein RJB36_1735 [Bacteroidota bacterium]|jgi:hypothetical protein
MYVGVFCLGQANAQTSIWTGASLNKKWSKHFESSFGTELRTELGNGFSKGFINTQQVFPIIKGIDPFISYRFSLAPASNSGLSPLNESVLNRFGIGVKVNFIDLFDIGKGRLNINWTVQQQIERSAVKRDVSMLRNRLQLKYDIKNAIFTPIISAEHFYRWNKDVVYTSTDVLILPGTAQFRYFIGTELELKHGNSFVCTYGFRQKFDSGALNGIVRISYSKSLK